MRYNSNRLIFKIICFFLVVFLLSLARKPIYSLYNGLKNSVKTVDKKTIEFKSKVYHSITGFSDKVKYVSNIDDLIEEKIKTREELEILRIKSQELEELKKENEQLKNLLSLKKSLPYKTIPARVKLVELGNESEYIYISKGREDSIQNGDAVIYDGYIIGRVNEVYSDYSKVMLLTSSESKLSVSINNKDFGILRGNSDGCFYINNYDIDVENSDELIFDIKTSGLSYDILKGIKVGTFEVKDKKIFTQTKQLKFRPAYNILDIRLVLVVRQEKK